MDRYFFHIIDKGELVRDEEGTLCADFPCAVEEAKASAKDLARQGIGSGVSPENVCVEIQDEEGKILGALTLMEVIRDPSNPHLQVDCNTPPFVVRH